MKIRWTNVFVFGMTIAVILLFKEYGSEIIGFLRSMKNIGPGHSTEEKTIGLMAFGLIAILVVSIVKIITQTSQKHREE